MSQYLQSPRPKQQTSPMPSSHPHTVGDAAARSMMREDDEDNDICPVCDGECTCANKPRPPQITSTPYASTSSIPAASGSSLIQAPAAHHKVPSLKIRLTIPPSMLGKRRASFSNPKQAGSTMSASAAGGGISTNPRPSTSFSAQYGTVPKRRGRPPKSLSAPRQLGIKSSNDAISFYNSSQTARRPAPKKPSASRPPNKLKGKNTTVKKKSSAKRRRVESSDSSSELSDVDHHYHHARPVQLPTFVPASVLSSSSDSDVSSSSGFDSDSSMEAEEESFIISQENEKSRVRRELLGEDGQPRRNPHENWVIRPRKRSVGPSDVEMEVDSDATEEEEEEEQEAEEDDDEADELPVGSGYIGVATGWSEEDEESSFDADVFFANLTDSDEDEDHSCPPDENDERGEDGDQSDLDSMSLSDTAVAGRSRLDLPFELMEDWDGQVIFSNGNGFGEGRGLLDVDFEEVNASVVETSASPSQDSYNEGDADTELEGDTTDEELVGEDHLPNERAMRMFKLPFSVSSINPLSTLSPSGSPAPRNRQPFGVIVPPKPADILLGHVFLEDSDSPDDFDDAPSVASKGNGPRTGIFVPTDAARAIIDDSHTDVPSPHPRVRGRRDNSASRLGRTSPRPPLTSRQLSLPPSSQPSFHLLSSSDLATSPELPAQTIDLDDVLDCAFLDSEPSEELSPSSPIEQSRKHLNLSRWGWGSDTPAADLDKVMKNSPLSLLWQDKDIAPSKPNRARDGDRTPTNVTEHHQQIPQNHIPTKSRKESRRERKLKQKNNMGYERPPHQQHYFRQHHPNSKTRSSGSAQRHNFNSSPPVTNV